MNQQFLLCLLLLIASHSVLAGNDQALAVAVSLGKERMVQNLLSQGGDANATNQSGRPLLHIAAFNGNSRTLKALLGAGADVNAVDTAGNTALMEAAAFGRLDIVKLLILGDVDVNLKNKRGSNALKRATQGKHQKVVDFLQESGATEEAADD